MSKICILGCSYTVGIEAIDEFIIPGYWDLNLDATITKNKHKDFGKINTMLFEIYKQKYNIRKYPAFVRKYSDDCRKYSWTELFRKLNGAEIIDFSVEGTGVEYNQYLYNRRTGEIKDDFYIRTDKNFKKEVIDSDLLIWQLPMEPRLFNTVKGYNKPLPIVGLESFDHLFKGASSVFKKWKQKILRDYFQILFDIDRYRKEKLNFVEMILNRRVVLNKPTIIFSMFSNYNINNNIYNQLSYLESELVHIIGFKGLSVFDKIIEEKRIVKEKSQCKFGHLTTACHQIVGKQFIDYIENNIGRRYLR